ncbi:MAG: NUDIX hydrolase [Acidimicrobiales bacterium]
MATDGIEITLDAVIVAVTDESPRLLTIDGPAGLPALPSGLLAPHDATLEIGLRRWVNEQTGLDVGYVEQLYTFGDRARGKEDGEGSLDGPRNLSIAYLALVREGLPSAGASWQNFYDFFPWEDHRAGRPAEFDTILPALDEFVAHDPGGEERAQRVKIELGHPGGPFDGLRVLERYELLYEAGLVFEASTVDPDPVGSTAPGGAPGAASDRAMSRPMHLDHRRIAATALGRLRGKLSYRPLVFELLSERFTLLQLQRVVEALAGARLHKQNFRRLVDAGGLVEGTGEQARTGGRPAELFRFRREVLGERPRPGFGTPRIRA